MLKFLAKNPINGEIALHCFQDMQNGQPIMDRSENVVLCGPSRIPFSIQANEENSNSQKLNLDLESNRKMGSFKTNFSLLFRYEGVHKIRPEILNLESLIGAPNLSEDDIFLPTVSFNVITKIL